MSVNYRFYIKTEKKPREIAQMMADAVDVKMNDSKYPPCYYVSTEDSSSAIYFLSEILENPNTRERIKLEWLEAYRFIPNVEVDIAYYSNHDPERKYDPIKKGITEILKRENGDAVLMENYDRPILERVDGQIVVTNDGKYNFVGYDWLKEELKRSGLKYEEHLLEPRQI